MQFLDAENKPILENEFLLPADFWLMNYDETTIPIKKGYELIGFAIETATNPG